jgi:CRISPR-associated protein Cmr3
MSETKNSVWVRIEPFDVLMFRDSKPFSAGESFRARSVFPPTPYPFIGAFRSQILAEILPNMGADFAAFADALRSSHSLNLSDLISVIGTSDDYGQLSFQGPFPALLTKDNFGHLYFPVPYDLGTTSRLSPIGASLLNYETNSCVHDHRAPQIWSRKTLGKPPQEAFLTDRGLIRYLKGEMPTDGEMSRALAQREERAGIALDSATRTAKQGLFYITEMLRLGSGYPDGEIGFALNIQGLTAFRDSGDIRLQPFSLPKSAPIRLGGEGRAASYQVVDADPLSSLKNCGEEIAREIDEKGQFKLYLASPAVFAGGWLPDCLKQDGVEDDWKLQLGDNQSIQVGLTAAVMGKPLPIGGWDLASRAPKPMLKAIPAGSTYCFKIIGNSKGVGNRLIKAFHGTCQLQSLADESYSQLGQAGFGLTFVGLWDYA